MVVDSGLPLTHVKCKSAARYFNEDLTNITCQGFWCVFKTVTAKYFVCFENEEKRIAVRIRQKYLLLSGAL